MMKGKRRKVLSFFILTLFLMGMLAGWSSGESATVHDAEDVEKFYASSAEDLDKEHAIYVNREERTVSVYATVNGKYLHKPTRHGLNWVEGAYGDMAVFNGYASPVAFYEALEDIGGNPALEKGGEPGEAFKETDEGRFIKGDALEVNITWDGADDVYDMNEVMVDSTGKKINYHFGGNYEAAKDHMTGCFMCFDSCPVGIVSNASQPVGAFADGKAAFHGDPELLPEDGTPVIVTFRFVESD